MLVLSRKTGEKLVIGDDVTIVVSRVSKNRVSLAIEAPDHVRIRRSELSDIQRQFEQADDDSLPPAIVSFTPEMDTTAMMAPRCAR